MRVSVRRASYLLMNCQSRLAVHPQHRRPSAKLAFSGGIKHIGFMDPPRGKLSDDQAKGAALEALRGPLTGYFRRRVREQDEVVDLVQEVFLRLATRTAGDDIDNLRGYVFQIAASVLADRQRRRTVRHQDVHVELDPNQEGESEIPADRVLVARDALQTAIAVLDQLPARTRTIFVLRRLEGLRYVDIAGRLGLSVSAVEKHMVRAIAHLAALKDTR